MFSKVAGLQVYDDFNDPDNSSQNLHQSRIKLSSLLINLFFPDAIDVRKSKADNPTRKYLMTQGSS